MFTARQLHPSIKNNPIVDIFYSDHLIVPLPESHRFPMPKYARLHQRVKSAALPGVTLRAAGPATDDQLRLVHDAEYVRKVAAGELSEKEIRRIGFPWSPELVIRSRYSVGGTIAACRSALSARVAANLAGGTHHAYPDHGEGYCVFNDVAVAARVMLAEQRVRRVLIVDLDVHQGNGTAAVFAGDPTVFTFSVHGQKNFPFHKETGDLDIALPDGADDAVFLEAVRRGLAQVLDCGRPAVGSPDLVIYIAGADPFIEDRLGRLAMSKDGLLRRDRLVFAACERLGAPLAVVMGGGYARNIDDVVDIHFQTIRLAAEFAQTNKLAQTGIPPDATFST